MTVRLSLNLPDEYSELLRKASEAEGRSLTEVIRRALNVYEFIGDNQRQGGRLIVERDGRAREVTFL